LGQKLFLRKEGEDGNDRFKYSFIVEIVPKRKDEKRQKQQRGELRKEVTI